MKRDRVFRYNTDGQWFKGNTHIHSTASDGGKNFSEITALYSERDYDFLFCTDHWVCSDAAAVSENFPVLLIDGIELDGQDETGALFHVVCLGKTSGLNRDDGLIEGMKKAREQGAVLILAHPVWCGNSAADALRRDFDGVELYNHVCHWINGKSNGLSHWNAMLEKNPDTLGFSVDDAHLRPEHPGYDGGWIVVNAPEPSRESILSAVKQGNYYSSQGPDFKSIAINGNLLHIECSSVQFIRLVGPSFRGLQYGSFTGGLLAEADIEIPRDWDYAYVEIEDSAGKRAWTNPLFATPKDRQTADTGR